jgi:hypothetical protein
MLLISEWPQRGVDLRFSFLCLLFLLTSTEASPSPALSSSSLSLDFFDFFDAFDVDASALIVEYG